MGFKLDRKYKEILDLALPASVENILHALVGFVDTLFIAKIGLAAITAIGIANNIMMVYLAIFVAIGTGTSSFIARYMGEKNLQKTKDIIIESILLSMAIGIVFSVASLAFGEVFLRGMGAEKEVLVKGKIFLSVVGGASFFISLLTTLGAVIRATGNTKSPMIINGIVNVLNILLDYILIFGWGWIPPLGVLGTAIGTVISRGIGCYLMFRHLGKLNLGIRPEDFFRRYDYKDLINLSIPAALERLVMRIGQVLYYGLIVSIGINTYAAHTIAGNIESFFYMPAFGLSTAASILLGNCVGRRDMKNAVEYSRYLMKITMVFALMGGFILFFGGESFASIFTRDKEAVDKIIIALGIDAFAQIPLGISIVYTGALQGMGDTKSPLYSTVIGMWGLRVIGVYILGVYLKMDIAGIWMAILFDLTARAVFLYFIFKKRIKAETFLFNIE